ncbi:MAG: hypothetical protein KGL35_03380 [Bradyrhizobium sp.]|uniref:hypothetical protein n=1 Tax=Bradyrhizobium sp. TaxID=376 RepID=UPI001C296DAD|nr:hypothetical protein [Bradyrhizobium sp.]MBU6461375.1 hypothetical protein [Pseudomonadota bacterium]MDE2066552.1 hypothetical protein [Bradyrhizobium sp.]MDE2467790.1 hypothetical protein [Bradyrhizobium sp.]
MQTFVVFPIDEDQGSAGRTIQIFKRVSAQSSGERDHALPPSLSASRSPRCETATSRFPVGASGEQYAFCDIGVQDLSGLPGTLFLLGVSGSPERYRFEFLGDSLRDAVAAGKFLDEVSPNVNFSYLRAQSSATVEAAAPTFFRLIQISGTPSPEFSCRCGGNGQVSMLLGAIDDYAVVADECVDPPR